MTNADPAKGIVAVVEELTDLDERRAELVAERDMLMVAARDNGTPWSELGRLSGLSVGAVKKALDRAKSNE